MRRRGPLLFGESLFHRRRREEDDAFAEAFALYHPGTFVERLAALLRPAVIRVIENRLRAVCS